MSMSWLRFPSLMIVSVWLAAGCGGAKKIGPDSGVSGSGGISGAGGDVGTGGSVGPVPDASADRPADLAGDRGGIVQSPDAAAIPAAGLTVDHAMINFGAVGQGETVTKTIVVNNTGLPAVVSPLVTGAGYVIQTTTCGTVALAANGSCTITIAFSPAANASGGASGTLTIGTGTSAISVALSPTALGGAIAAITVRGASAGGSESQTVNLLGNGVAPP